MSKKVPKAEMILAEIIANAVSHGVRHRKFNSGVRINDGTWKVTPQSFSDRPGCCATGAFLIGRKATDSTIGYFQEFSKITGFDLDLTDDVMVGNDESHIDNQSWVTQAQAIGCGYYAFFNVEE